MTDRYVTIERGHRFDLSTESHDEYESCRMAVTCLDCGAEWPVDECTSLLVVAAEARGHQGRCILRPGRLNETPWPAPLGQARWVSVQLERLAVHIVSPDGTVHVMPMESRAAAETMLAGVKAGTIVGTPDKYVHLQDPEAVW